MKNGSLGREKWGELIVRVPIPTSVFSSCSGKSSLRSSGRVKCVLLCISTEPHSYLCHNLTLLPGFTVLAVCPDSLKASFWFLIFVSSKHNPEPGM